MSEVSILSIETLHVKTTIDKKSYEKALRFARTLIDSKGNKTREVLLDDKWTEIEEVMFYAKAEETRKALIEKLKADLLKKVKPKQVKKTAEKPAQEEKTNIPAKAEEPKQ